MAKPLIPRLIGMVVVLRIPKNTPYKESQEARNWQRNLARKISKEHEKDHWYEKGEWK